ncbi:MAG: SHOCT domain-containing protein [Chloroflexi bacterium]|nr:SHOCT domain-containing protein [Chloroflexota bacterium]
MMLFWVLIIGGVGVLVVWLLQQGRPAGIGAGPAQPRALEILKERYARGEITLEQYEQMRRDIEAK